MKEQLTLEMLCSYLPYGLKVKTIGIFENDPIFEMSLEQGKSKATIDWILKDSIKPIFRNLKTDLTREIEHNGERFVPMAKLLSMRSIKYHSFPAVKKHSCAVAFRNELIGNRMDYDFVLKLLSWHFWIYDQSFFEKGIILDINNVAK